MLTQFEEDAVRSIVKDFMSKDLLFTALDISNEAKKAIPHLRHREVRDVVRSMFGEMQNNGWARTNIDVTLEDGTKQTALLYFPLSASWDLDNLYNDQRRTQTSSRPADSVTPVAVAQAVVSQVVDAVADPAVVVQAVAQQVVNTAHEAWKSLFGSKPSLFPRQ